MFLGRTLEVSRLVLPLERCELLICTCVIIAYVEDLHTRVQQFTNQTYGIRLCTAKIEVIYAAVILQQ